MDSTPEIIPSQKALSVDHHATDITEHPTSSTD